MVAPWRKPGVARRPPIFLGNKVRGEAASSPRPASAGLGWNSVATFCATPHAGGCPVFDTRSPRSGHKMVAPWRKPGDAPQPTRPFSSEIKSAAKPRSSPAHRRAYLAFRALHPPQKTGAPPSPRSCLCGQGGIGLASTHHKRRVPHVPTLGRGIPRTNDARSS